MKATLGLVILAIILVIWLVKKAARVGNAVYDATLGEAPQPRPEVAPQRIPPPKPSEDASFAVHVCSELIELQLRATGWTAHKLSRDRWALGYVWGFIDGVRQRMGINAEHDVFGVQSASFITLFADPEISATLFTLCIRSQGMTIFDQGVKKGGQDAFRAIDTKTPTFGLSEHLSASAVAR